MKVELRNKRIEEDLFMKKRKEVLFIWPTGKEVDLEEAVDYQKALPEAKNFSKIVERLHEEERTVVFPRAGTPILEDMIRLCQKLVDLGVPLIPVTTDSYTRLLQFQKVEEALKESYREGRAKLNGFPVVNYGVKKTRKLVESVREGGFTPRVSRLAQPIVAEIAFASGMTAIGTCPFISFGAYEKNCTLEEAIKTSQYVSRLAGYYAEKGVTIAADVHGWIPTGVFPLSVNIATMIISALLSAEQGVKRIIPLVHSMGNMVQDLAYVQVTKKLMREYLDRFGFRDVLIPGVSLQQVPLYPMPQDRAEAFAYIDYTAMLACLAGVESVFLRTVDEGTGIPDESAHELTYRSANWIFNVVRQQKIQIRLDGLDQEVRITEAEVRAILEKVLEMGEGDVAIGSVRAVAEGILDSPFSPNQNVKDKVLGIKDINGAVRYLEFGNLPIPEEIKQFHKEKVAERERREKREMNYFVSIEDFWAFSRGRIIGRSNDSKK